MAGVLSTLSEALAAAVAEAGRAVVRVEARRRIPASGVVWSEEGVVVTAHHGVEREEGVRVGLPDGQAVPATLVGRDPTTDLAVLRAEARGLTAARWGDLDTLKVGHLALALGRPGESVRATLGVVSALGGSWVTPAGGRVDRYLQSDAAMYPGFSGGPLVDVEGRVLGVNTSALLRVAAVAVPASTVRRVVEALLATGRVRRAYLGVSAQPVRLPAALAEALGQDTGLLVAAVAPGSPAEQAGLLLGDILVAVGGQPVRSIEDLLARLSAAQVGERVGVRVVRGGQAQEVVASVGEHP